MSPEVQYSLQAAAIVVALTNPAVRVLLSTMFGVGQWQVTFLIAAIYFGIVYYLMVTTRAAKDAQKRAEELAAEAAKANELRAVF